MSAKTKRELAIQAELEKIRARHGGRLTRHDVVREARKNKSGVLGKMFDWDIQSAAMAHWLDRAGEIITQYVSVVIVHRDRKIKIPLYVRDATLPADTGGYIAVT